MSEYINNPEQIKDIDIDETVVRVKALIVNTKNELLLGYSHHTYQFPGGHLEKGEDLTKCLKREIKEETGLSIEINNEKPFFLIKHYTKNYRNTNKNRLSLVYYYAIKTDKEYCLSNTHYTEDEEKGNFSLLYVNIEEVEGLLIKSIPDNAINEIIVKEMLMAIEEYKKLLI